ncbi:MAG: low molecular weight protein-tyrosine-phosphatase [Planctomycetota bacterium]|nr:low molecular weight protein-tyrosine-phosphatase [Planctomycetota bacterium]
MNSGMSIERVDNRLGVLFVCLGNICRSPMAKGLFLHLIQQRGVADQFDVDSCGTGHWHAGRPADPRTAQTLRERNVPLEHIARVVAPGTDFQRFHYILAMDRKNLRDLLNLGADPVRTRLMMSFDPSLDKDSHVPDVPDPYSGGYDGFTRVHDMLLSACEGLLRDALARRSER